MEEEKEDSRGLLAMIVFIVGSGYSRAKSRGGDGALLYADDD